MTKIADLDEETDIVTLTDDETGFYCMMPYAVYFELIEQQKKMKVQDIISAIYGTPK